MRPPEGSTSMQPWAIPHVNIFTNAHTLSMHHLWHCPWNVPNCFIAFLHRYSIAMCGIVTLPCTFLLCSYFRVPSRHPCTRGNIVKQLLTMNVLLSLHAAIANFWLDDQNTNIYTQTQLVIHQLQNTCFAANVQFFFHESFLVSLIVQYTCLIEEVYTAIISINIRMYNTNFIYRHYIIICNTLQCLMYVRC